MTKPEARNREEVPPEERVENGVGRKTLTREAPIDQNVVGELNAALPEDIRTSERRTHMAENTPQEYKQLSREELETLAGEELPERAAMSLINANIAAPINAAVALNVASDGSVAYANAEQTGDITQSN
jgi:hypothetical protein